MALLRRLLSPLGFALAGLCFLLLFLAISHHSETERIALTWQGADLVVGGDSRLHIQELLWDERVRRYTMQDVSAEIAPIVPESRIFIPAQPAVRVTAILIVAGVLAELLVGAQSRTLMAGAAGLLAAATLVLGEWLAARRIESTVNADDVTAAPVYGFWLAVGLLTLLGVGNAAATYRLRSRRRPPPDGGLGTAKSVT